MDAGEGRKGGILGKELPFFLDCIIEREYVRVAPVISEFCVGMGAEPIFCSPVVLIQR